MKQYVSSRLPYLLLNACSPAKDLNEKLLYFLSS